MSAPTTIDDVLSGSPYRDYLYSYPHKSAYRPFAPPRPLTELWTAEDREALFLYIHIPFCEMRCGFCNLFTTPKPDADPVEAYVAALERQAAIVGDALGERSFARMAIGGGTPTYLDPEQLHRVFDVAERMGLDLARAPISVETSPETGSIERLRVLIERGVTRISIGVQSFDDDEVKSAGRAQQAAQVERTLDAIRSVGAATLNIDLMYGLAGQDLASFRNSIDRAIAFGSEEIYLYPLYVRPLTGLGRQYRSWDDQRLGLYRGGREHLLASGYEQVSMRMFRRGAESGDGPIEYVCQRDGMVGLGVGARSYTNAVHYSSDYAVANRGVKKIISDYVGAPDDEHARASHGVELEREEWQRRYLILSLLTVEGLDLAAYRQRFASEARADFPEIGALEARRALTVGGERAQLTPLGIERSDAIGPWLRSASMNARMASAERR